MESKIRVKVGSIEVEYEGTQAFIEKELLGFLGSLVEVSKSAPHRDKGSDGDHEPQTHPKSVSQIAQSAHAKTGSELSMAAAKFLAGPEGSREFSRKELLDAMKSATTFYKKNFCSNLTKILNALVNDGRLHDIGKGKYSLPGS